MIQNADDASATEVEFLLDLTHHGTEFLIHPDVAKYQGPALYAWNNSVFDADDWEGIRNIGDSWKEMEVLKVGRFALGFISVYHLTGINIHYSYEDIFYITFNVLDFPCILSNDNVLLLDPHMVIDNTGGLLIGLEEFATHESVKSQLNCFKDYFGYDGGGCYNGTIFRFPLRTGEYETSLPKNVYDSNKVLEKLFGPFKQEVENCLLFMKSLNVIKVSVKEAPGAVRLLYSAEINPEFRDSLRRHRLEMCEFIIAKKYLITSSCYISIFPVTLIESDLNRTLSIWLVINILGLIDSGISDTYLPWVSIAIPLPHSQQTLHSIACRHCWSMEFVDINRLFDLIDIHLPTILLSSEVTDFEGSLFCFLPIAASSKFPFHVQGYFALSTNRRSIKWPRYDDSGLEPCWNRRLVQSLGTICYAVLIHISVNRLHCRGSSALAYKLFSCLPPASEHDQLQAVMHKGALSIMQGRALVCARADAKWVSLESAYFLPSPFSKHSIPCEELCGDFLTALSQPVVEVPSDVAQVLLEYSFLRDRVVPQIVSPHIIRQFLIGFKGKECLTDFLRNRDSVCSLLQVVLSDIYEYNTVSILDGIQLIPICNSELPKTFDSQLNKKFYIYERPLDFIKLFPGLESNFIEPSLPPAIHASLLKLSRTLRINLTDISNIRTDPRFFFKFLNCSMQQYFNTKSVVKWTPGANGQPEKNWIESVWKFINKDKGIIDVLKQNKLPILPKQNVSSPEIDLLPLPLHAPPTPYMKLSSTTHSRSRDCWMLAGAISVIRTHFWENITNSSLNRCQRGFSLFYVSLIFEIISLKNCSKLTIKLDKL